MKRLIIIVEGSSEEEFVNQTLSPYLLSNFGIYDVRAIRVRTSKTHKGGFVRYDKLKNDVVELLKRERNAVISTLIDFFAIPTSMPDYKDCMNLRGVDRQINCLEKAMYEDIGNNQFLPYIQKHEFEALVFAAQEAFDEFLVFFPIGQQSTIKAEFQQVVSSYPNPENINSGNTTAPSKRLMKIIPGYHKVLHGNLLIEEAGMNRLLIRCPRFKNWVNQLVEMIQY